VDFVLPIAQRGSTEQQFPFAANTWTSVKVQINSPQWNTINGLFMGYTARVSTDGGATWLPWGGFTAISPTFKKDFVTKIEPLGFWEWNSAFAAGGILAIVLDIPTPFAWGATITVL
jgi:hypothetical protein